MRKRVLMGRLAHETHTFLRHRTGLSDFSFVRAEDLPALEEDGSTLAGSLQVARERGWEAVPAVAMDAMPGGLVSDEAVEAFWSAFRGAAQRGGRGGLDGICLNLHGAMVSESQPDVEG